MLLNRLTCIYKYLKVYFSLAIQYVCSRDIIFFSATEKQSPTLLSRVNIFFQPPEKKYLASTVHRVHKKNRPDFSLCLMCCSCSSSVSLNTNMSSIKTITDFPICSRKTYSTILWNVLLAFFNPKGIT